MSRFSKKTAFTLATGALSAGLLFLFFFILLVNDDRAILFQSLESKTSEGGPVFNRVRWIPGWKKDIWLMQQSHRGVQDEFHRWDRLAIVVDKTATPRTARYYQFEPGNLDWDSNAKMRPFRAACFMCHSNGPRVVRPDYESPQVRVSFLDQARISVWALRVKSYGRVVADPIHEKTSEGWSSTSKVTPFRYPHPQDNERLASSTCIKCHHDSWWGRGSLTRQNFMSIGFMVDNGFMPPPGFRMTDTEKKDLEKFRLGL